MPKTSTTPEPSTLRTLKQVASDLHLTEFRVRSAIREGDLKTTLEPVKDGSKTNRHMISQAAVDEWRSHTGTGTRRADGRNKYNIYMTADEYVRVIALLEDNAIEAPVVRANTPKTVSEPAVE